MATRPYFTVGLTGGIGSGKSAATDALRQAGAAVVDADVLAHRVTAAGGAAIEQIRSRFGSGFIEESGALDRSAMRRHVFADPAARQALEAIVHPLVRQAVEDEALGWHRAGVPYVIFAIPLLVESGQWTQRVDRVLVVDAPQALQVQRVMRRSGLSATEVLTIIAQQASRATRLAAAHDVLVNVGPPTRLARHAARLHAQYLHLANAYAMASAGAL